MKIVTIPHPLLTKKTRPVSSFDKKLKRIVKDMEETLDNQRDPEGVGLSANQVAIDLSLFIVKHPENKKLHVFINPKLEKMEYVPPKKTKKGKKKEENESLEGCLSIPGIWAPVKRYDRVMVSYQDINGETQEQWFEGFMSVVVQHEHDHLEGILFTQRALEQGNPIYQEVNGKLKLIDYV